MSEGAGERAARERLAELCDRIRAATLGALRDARRTGTERELALPKGHGAGDVAFGLDLPAEAAALEWARERAREGPLSLLTEDAGWRHLGTGPDGSPVELGGFDHGGPRIALDPVDGTRNLMADLRSAWTVVSYAPPGRGEPRLSDLTAGVVSEIPTSAAARFRRLSAERGGPCLLEDRPLAGGPGTSRALAADADDRVDHGYFPVFRYRPEHRPHLARLEAELFARLAREEGADLRAVYDDQYVSNAGQLVLLSLGTYRMVIDARALVAERLGEETVTAKPYDLAGAVLCAERAGAVVTAADGAPLDFPLDATTPVHFAGYANEATRRRIERHWLGALDATWSR